jgi:hypothetical protein
MPSRYSRRYDQGFFRRDRTLLYVGRGIAAKHPIRYRCLPEISRFTVSCPAFTGPEVRDRAELLVGSRQLG